MKKTLLCLSLALGAFCASADDGVPVLYGVQTYSKSETSSGVYTVRAEKDAQPEIYWSDGDLMGNGGAIYVEGKYYVLNYLNYFGTMYWTYVVCDLDAKTYSWSMNSDFTPKDVGSALTYDASTGVVYSVCLDEQNQGGFTLSTMNITDGSKSPVVSLKMRLLAMAATLDGTLYGIGSDGCLYILDKSTGDTKLVGATGVEPSDVNQSAVIDYDTNVMYWAAMKDGSSGLYTVDLSTGAATQLSEFTDNNQLVGLSLKQSSVKPSAPAPADNLKVEFNKADLKGSLSFTMPSENASGSPLEGTLAYTVSTNGHVLASGEEKAGETVLVTVEVPASGNTPFTLVLRNEAGESSLPVTISRWVGPDTPTAVSDLSLSADGNELTLTWNMTETGKNGGYVDPEQVRYAIVRHPGDVVVAEAHEGLSFKETLEVSGMAKVSYSVTPFVGTLAGPGTESSTVVVGSGLAVPFTEDLTKDGCLDFYTVVDANGDGFRWYYSYYDGAVIADYTTSCDTNDDWLFTPKFHLEAGTSYRLTLDLRSAGIRNWNTYEYEDAYAGNIGASLGASAAVEDMRQTVIEDTEVSSAVRYKLTSADFEVETDGDYVLGVSHTGKSGYPALNLYGIQMEVTGTSGVDNISADGGVAVLVAGNALTVVNPAGVNVTVCNVDGRIVCSGSDSLELQLPSGVYLVATPSRTIKVLVR